MNKTPNYQLNQWDKNDRIQMEDFNADNAKIEAALAEQASAIANCGNCKIVTGSYVGTGTNGINNQITLNFSHKPIMVAITGERHMTAINPHSKGFFSGNTSYAVTTWGKHSLTWYSEINVYEHMNKANETYYYVALLLSDE